MKIRTLITELWLPRPLGDVFAFFSDAWNLNLITPPWLDFQVLTPKPIDLHAGTLLDYRLKWHGLPLKWRTEISVWEPPYRFVDRQIRGPYRQWIHEHRFEERDGGTWVHDRVDYAVPGWLLEPTIHKILVGPDVRRIFAYRQAKMREILAHGKR